MKYENGLDFLNIQSKAGAKNKLAILQHLKNAFSLDLPRFLKADALLGQYLNLKHKTSCHNYTYNTEGQIEPLYIG